jgi:hypothetical protein
VLILEISVLRRTCKINTHAILKKPVLKTLFAIVVIEDNKYFGEDGSTSYLVA